mmetsp:Transcript_113689/g.302115  ORF Transcript_113689/g.302115 Transcript_113689/m.302115 type:complete len:234 (+) Transcript_113689:105-806(+)
MVPGRHAMLVAVLPVERPAEDHGVSHRVEHDHEGACDQPGDHRGHAGDGFGVCDEVLGGGVLESRNGVHQDPGEVGTDAGDRDEAHGHEEGEGSTEQADRRDLVRDHAEGELSGAAERLGLHSRDYVRVLVHEADEALEGGHAAAAAPCKDLRDAALAAAAAAVGILVVDPLVDHAKDEVDGLQDREEQRAQRERAEVELRCGDKAPHQREGHHALAAAAVVVLEEPELDAIG